MNPTKLKFYKSLLLKLHLCKEIRNNVLGDHTNFKSANIIHYIKLIIYHSQNGLNFYNSKAPIE